MLRQHRTQCPGTHPSRFDLRGEWERFVYRSPHRSLMKIGITCYPTYGGSGVVATELGIELAARGHEVHFVTSSPHRSALPAAKPTSSSTKSPYTSTRSLNTRPTTSPLQPAWPRSPSSTRSTSSTSTTPFPHSVSALLARQMLAARGKTPALHHDPPRHRHHVGRPRPLLPAYYPLRHHAVRWSDGDLQLSPRPHPRGLRHRRGTRPRH